MDISSTAIRERIRLKQSIKYLLPDKVKDEIEKARYYKT
jgi:nicotinic acid mononucleotide adenylyltransferase